MYSCSPLSFFFLMIRRPPRSTLFPSRRSSDLLLRPHSQSISKRQRLVHLRSLTPLCASAIDRKSTRLNSSHTVISYAVFCLKKKKYDQRNLLSSTNVR